MGKIKDLTGQRFGRLIAMYPTDERKQGCVVWICKCDCGQTIRVSSCNLRRLHTQSCGCKIKKLLTTHGQSNSRLHGVWSSMLMRCNNPNRDRYKHYGGRGIKVCEEWATDFAAFQTWAMANGYDPDAPYGQCTLDRIDVNGDYCPENCRWVDIKTQNQNKRRRQSKKK